VPSNSLSTLYGLADARQRAVLGAAAAWARGKRGAAPAVT